MEDDIDLRAVEARQTLDRIGAKRRELRAIKRDESLTDEERREAIERAGPEPTSEEKQDAVALASHFGIPVIEIAERLGMQRSQVYRDFERALNKRDYVRTSED